MPQRPPSTRLALRKYAWLSIAAACVTMGLKVVAYLVTGSVGLLSDAAESLVNLAGAMMALWMLTVAAREPDDDHAYGHSKAEYFSSGFEGGLIIVAAVAIAVAATNRLMHPRALEQVGMGLAVSVVASLVNFGVARVLLRAGRAADSITLEADASHLLTDVWTSVGVVIGIAAVVLTGWQRLDPIIALLVAANIVWAGVRIIRTSVLGLMDTAIPSTELAAIRAAISPYTAEGIETHALRTRQAGSRRFVSLHVLVPGDWTVHRGHQLLERLEGSIRDACGNATVLTHLESLDDAASWDDVSLDRAGPAPTGGGGPQAGAATGTERSGSEEGLPPRPVDPAIR